MKQVKINKIIILFLMIVILGCGTKVEKYEKTEFAFGTLIKIIIYEKNIKLAEEATNKAFEEIKRIDTNYNTKVENSLFYKLNSSKNKEIILAEEAKILMKKVLEVSKESDEMYDITVSPLLELWGFYNEEAKVKIPSKEELENTLKLVNYKNIIIDNNKMYLKNKEQKIDTGSFLKGYAIYKAKEVLKSEGINSAFISALSSIELIGDKQGKNWRIGLQNPNNPKEILKILSISDRAIGVSGDYQTYVEIDGKRYHHILNPKTGYPSSENKMVVIVADNAFLADIYSTALFSFNYKKIFDFIKKYNGMEAFVVDKNNNIHISDGLKENIVEP
ncbi:MAG: FAD:protein transferase [Fusobacteriales bacterium]|jgi:thiamine biosynthesis lipoprotein|nr:FAD:protein transferase [Fusobacteriales bacterium]